MIDDQPKKTRRSNGEGTQLADGRWQVRLKLPNGKMKPFYGKTKREAQRKRDDARHALQEGKPLPPGRLTLCRYLTGHSAWPAYDQDGESLPAAGWLGDVVIPGTRPSTAIRYEINVRKYLVPALGRITLTNLTARDVQQMIAAKIAAGLAPRTVHQMLAVLHNALAIAVKQSLVGANICDAVSPPKMERAVVRSYSATEALLLLEAARGHRLDGTLHLALTTGLRLGEILGLTWENVDLMARVLRVKWQSRRVKGFGLSATPPKSNSSRRAIPLTDPGIEALLRQREANEVLREAGGDKWQEHGLVFPNSRGRRWEPRAVEQILDKLEASAGLSRVTPHGLRHSTGTLLHSLGVDIKVIQAILGHTSIVLTSGTYVDDVPELHQEAMDKLGRLLSPQHSGASTTASARLHLLPKTP